MWCFFNNLDKTLNVYVFLCKKIRCRHFAKCFSVSKWIRMTKPIPFLLNHQSCSYIGLNYLWFSSFSKLGIFKEYLLFELSWFTSFYMVMKEVLFLSGVCWSKFLRKDPPHFREISFPWWYFSHGLQFILFAKIAFLVSNLNSNKIGTNGFRLNSVYLCANS